MDYLGNTNKHRNKWNHTQRKKILPQELYICTLKRKELYRRQRQNRPQCLEGQFGTCWAVLAESNQNSSRWYRLGPSNFWIGYTKSYFGTSSEFGLSDSQIKMRFGPNKVYVATVFSRQKGRKETAVFGSSWRNHTSDTIQIVRFV